MISYIPRGGNANVRRRRMNVSSSVPLPRYLPRPSPRRTTHSALRAFRLRRVWLGWNCPEAPASIGQHRRDVQREQNTQQARHRHRNVRHDEVESEQSKEMICSALRCSRKRQCQSKNRLFEPSPKSPSPRVQDMGAGTGDARPGLRSTAKSTQDDLDIARVARTAPTPRPWTTAAQHIWSAAAVVSTSSHSLQRPSTDSTLILFPVSAHTPSPGWIPRPTARSTWT